MFFEQEKFTEPPLERLGAGVSFDPPTVANRIANFTPSENPVHGSPTVPFAFNRQQFAKIFS